MFKDFKVDFLDELDQFENNFFWKTYFLDFFIGVYSGFWGKFNYYENIQLSKK